MVTQFLKSLERLDEYFNTVLTQNMDITTAVDPSKSIYDFKEKRRQQIKDNIQNCILDIKKKAAELLRKSAGHKDNEQIAYDISVQTRFLEELYKEPEKAQPVLLKMRDLASSLQLPDEGPIPRSGAISFKICSLPEDIQEEVLADVSELQKCFSTGCFRSCVILCGRILETTLHRKYYDATGHDILEKSPGIGLGNLIGKLKDKNIAFDPGLSQQIHLINQVRIFSVHKKQESFYPTKDQTHAIILYTLDVVKRIL